MKILIVSDTHRRDAALRDLIEDLKPLDMFIHLGDAEGSREQIRRVGESDLPHGDGEGKQRFLLHAG